MASEASAPFLTGIPDDAVFYPVITLVFNLSAQPWNGAHSLHGMFKNYPPELLREISDHRFLLIDPHALSKRKCRKLRTDLHLVCECLRLSRHRNELRKMVEQNPRFRSMNARTANLIKSVLSLKLELNDKDKGDVNMCQAIEEWIQEERALGKQEGFQEGEQKGFQEGEQKGEKKGIHKLLSLQLKQGLITEAEAMEYMTSLGVNADNDSASV